MNCKRCVTGGKLLSAGGTFMADVNGICLVTGGAGFIGSHLTDLLLEEGSKVRVLDNLRNGKKENIRQHLDRPDFEFIKGNILDPKDLEKAMDGIGTVFHLACLGVRHSLANP